MYVAKSFEQLLEKCVNLCCDKIRQKKKGKSVEEMSMSNLDYFPLKSLLCQFYVAKKPFRIIEYLQPNFLPWV